MTLYILDSCSGTCFSHELTEYEEYLFTGSNSKERVQDFLDFNHLQSDQCNWLVTDEDNVTEL